MLNDGRTSLDSLNARDLSTSQVHRYYTEITSRHIIYAMFLILSTSDRRLPVNARKRPSSDNDS